VAPPSSTALSGHIVSYSGSLKGTSGAGVRLVAGTAK
jgi:hypothetical protein